MLPEREPDENEGWQPVIPPAIADQRRRNAEAQELLNWVEMYGHPEEWVKRAQAAHNRAENLYRDLETVRRYHGEEITAKARLIGVIIRLRQVYSPEGVGVWLFSVNRKLDGQVPWTLMVDGRLDEVERALPRTPRRT